MAKYTTDSDRLVARNLKVARAVKGMSQEELAGKLDITFQQVQKYEKCTNRISAGRLKQVAGIFGLPIAYFYREDMFKPIEQDSDAPELTATMLSRDGLELNRAYARIQDDKVRKRVIQLVKALSEEVEAMAA